MLETWIYSAFMLDFSPPYTPSDSQNPPFFSTVTLEITRCVLSSVTVEKQEIPSQL
jgi:hypothetical protein